MTKQTAIPYITFSKLFPVSGVHVLICLKKKKKSEIHLAITLFPPLKLHIFLFVIFQMGLLRHESMLCPGMRTQVS